MFSQDSKASIQRQEHLCVSDIGYSRSSTESLRRTILGSRLRPCHNTELRPMLRLESDRSSARQFQEEKTVPQLFVFCHHLASCWENRAPIESASYCVHGKS